MELLEGKKISEKILQEIAKRIKSEKTKPGLGVILVGEDEASKIYVNLKEKAAQNVGIHFHKIKLPENVSEESVLKEIEKINSDPKIHGIIVQLPLPAHLNKQKIIATINFQKDVDGFLKNEFDPVLPKAILKLLESTGINFNNQDAIILCNSEEFGKTMEFTLEKNGIFANFILKEEVGSSLEEIKSKEVIIVACGIPGLVHGNMIKEGAVVIDAGITRVGEKVVGDVDFESVKNKASYITPVPGGVGPVTIACLLENVYLAAKKSR